MPIDGTDGGAGAPQGTAGVRCECDHLTDFITVHVPSNWEELREQAATSDQHSNPRPPRLTQACN